MLILFQFLSPTWNVEPDVFPDVSHGFELFGTVVALEGDLVEVVGHVSAETRLRPERPVALRTLDGAARVVVLKVQPERAQSVTQTAAKVTQVVLRNHLVNVASVPLKLCNL